MLDPENLPLSAPTAVARRGAATGFVSAGLHALALLGVLALPLLLDSELPPPTRGAHAFLADPLELAPPPPPPPPAAGAAKARAASPVAAGGFVAPVEVPTEIVTEALDLGLDGGMPGGVEGGIPGGVVGGVVGGLPDAAPPPAARPLRAGHEVQAPRRVRYVAPEYPDFARRAGIEGVVVVECLIDERGRVRDAKVVKPLPLLDDAALMAVREWAYLPTLYNGVPTPVLLTLTVTFELKRGY